jgi:hypothetical protein
MFSTSRRPSRSIRNNPFPVASTYGRAQNRPAFSTLNKESIMALPDALETDLATSAITRNKAITFLCYVVGGCTLLGVVVGLYLGYQAANPPPQASPEVRALTDQVDEYVREQKAQQAIQHQP